MSWQPDSESSSCTLCSEAFTFFNRKHHCRKCGKLVCGACSSHFPAYPPTALVLHGDRAPTKPSILGQYRTCETCALEIERNQRNGGETGGLYAGQTKLRPQENHIMNGVALSGPSSGVTELGASGSGEAALSGDTVGSATVGSTAVGSTEENEEDFCPVCGKNLLQRFKGQKDCTEWEMYKEGHVGECITSFDFASDHLRLSSPPGAQASRNRMLVYNIPPIPRPSYEPIRGSEPIQNPHSVPEAEGEYGSMTSNATMTSEKEPSDNECVICLEDLKPGDKVGRLECLCVFHYICIKNWFNKKSFAECPIHFLHR